MNLMLKKKLNRKRQAIITPCVALSTSSYYIDELLNREYRVVSIASPKASTDFIKDRFNVKNDWKQGANKSLILESQNPDLRVEQLPLENFVPSKFEEFDIICDENPFLSFASKNLPNLKATVATTIFGHALNVAGLLFVQTEGAENYKERTQLTNNIIEHYPESHFVLVESRRTPWGRQFLFIKVARTVEN